MILASAGGCGAERFNGIDAENLEPSGSGGASDNSGVGAAPSGTGGVVTNDDAGSPAAMGSGGAGLDDDAGAVGSGDSRGSAGSGGSGGNAGRGGSGGRSGRGGSEGVDAGRKGSDGGAGRGGSEGRNGRDGGTGGARVPTNVQTGGRGIVDARDASAPDAPDRPSPRDAGDAGDAADAVDAPDDALACPGGTQDLSNVATGDFRISFRVVTTQTGWVALINQRSDCSYATFWDIRLQAAGRVRVELDDNTTGGYEGLESTQAVNDGRPHAVVVARVAGRLSIQIDGAAASEGGSPLSLGTLPPLQVGNDICVTAVKSPATAMFSGTLTDICITRG